MRRFCSVLVAMLVIAVYVQAQEHVQFTQADVETGFNLYNSNCITCHGANGDSIAGVNLRSGQFRRASSDSDLNRLIQTGVLGTAMPPGQYSPGGPDVLVGCIRSVRDFRY